MNLHSLKPAKGSTHKDKRLGRGEASGKGGTSTKGNKGGQSRAGYKSKKAHEGGQMPIQRRLPKRGFKNPNRVEYVGVNLDVLQGLAEKYDLKAISFDTLQEHGLISKNDLVKIMGRGEITVKLDVKAHAFTATAQKAIEALGGSVEKI